ncbi:MAG: sugar-binding protein [Monoglobaceae bacterium]
MMKRIRPKLIKGIALIIAAIMCLPGGFSVFAEEEEAVYAYIIYGKPDKVLNLTATGNVDTVERDGRIGKKTNHANNVDAIAIDVDDNCLYDIPNYTPIDVTVEYFDEGYGKFSLIYNTHNPSAAYVKNAAYSLTHTDSIELTNSLTWKSHTFRLEDMKFAGFGGWKDLRLTTWNAAAGYSPEDVIFGSVYIKPGDYVSPIDIGAIQSAKTGNIFAEGEEIALNNSFFNKTNEEFGVTAKYIVYDSEGKELETQTIQFDVLPNDTVVKEYSFTNPGIYDLYDIELQTVSVLKDNAAKVYEASSTGKFSVAVDSSDIKNEQYGLNNHGLSRGMGTLEEYTYLMGAAGASYMRGDSLYWAEVEKSKGKYEIDQSWLKKADETLARGIKVHTILCGGNKLYYPCTNEFTTPPSTDEDIEAFANYCGYVAGALKGRVESFEIWNEWNLTSFNKTNEPPETYAKLLKAAYKAIKKANPDAIVVGGDTSRIPLDWFERVFEAGGYDYCDAISVHPYDWSTEDFDVDAFLTNAQGLKDLMHKYGPDKPIWATEVGFNTSDGRYSNEKQAKETVILNLFNKYFNVYERLFQYCLYDRDNQSDIESCWGLVNYWASPYHPHSAKESYLALCAMNKFIGDAKPDKHLIDNEFCALGFKNSNLGDVLVVIAKRNEKMMAYNLGCGSVDIYDMYGNKMDTVYSDNGEYSFTVTDKPVYVVGNFNELSYGEAPPIAAETTELTAVGGDETILYFTKNTDKEITLYADENAAFEVVENADFTDGKATLRLKMTDDFNKDTSFNVRAKDEEGKVYYCEEFRIKSVSPITVEVTNEVVNENQMDRYRARVVVKNITNTAVLSGKVYVSEPEEIAANSVVREFKNLNPGEELTLFFNIPLQTVYEVTDISIKTELNMGYEEVYTKKLEFANANYAETKPTIDGVISYGEWNGPWFGAKESRDVVNINDWGGPDDLSFRAKTMWDEENLYFLGVVKDDVFSVGSEPKNMWQADNIQIGIDDVQDKNTMDTSTFTELGFAYVEGCGDTVYRFKSAYYDDLVQGVTVENAQIKIQRCDGYTVYECAIPWSEIFYDGYQADPNLVYKFSAICNDSDGGGRRGWIEYMSGIGAVKDVTKFGSFRLMR